MRKLAVLTVTVILLNLCVSSIASAESVLQQIYDGIKGWGQSSSQAD
ncbi:hypothetical protein ACFL5E_02605 [Candidatus Omnitrophota bacterium]